MAGSVETIAIPHNRDISIFVLSDNVRQAAPRAFAVNNHLPVGEFGTKLSRLMTHREVVPKTTGDGMPNILKTLSKGVKLAVKPVVPVAKFAVKEKNFASTLRVSAGNFRSVDEVMREAVLEAACALWVKPFLVTGKTLVAVYAKIPVGIIHASGTAAHRLGLSFRCGVRIRKLKKTKKLIGKHYLYENPGPALFLDRFTAQTGNLAWANIKAMAKRLVEIGARLLIPVPGLVGVLAYFEGLLAKSLQMYHQKRLAEVSNMLLRGVETAGATRADYYEILRLGHISLPVYALAKFDTAELVSFERSSPLLDRKTHSQISDVISYLKRRANEFGETSKFTVSTLAAAG